MQDGGKCSAIPSEFFQEFTFSRTIFEHISSFYKMLRLCQVSYIWKTQRIENYLWASLLMIGCYYIYIETFLSRFVVSVAASWNEPRNTWITGCALTTSQPPTLPLCTHLSPRRLRICLWTYKTHQVPPDWSDEKQTCFLPNSSDVGNWRQLCDITHRPD
jgi:hypothetical protein